MAQSEAAATTEKQATQNTSAEDVLDAPCNSSCYISLGSHMHGVTCPPSPPHLGLKKKVTFDVATPEVSMYHVGIVREFEPNETAWFIPFPVRQWSKDMKTEEGSIFYDMLVKAYSD